MAEAARLLRAFHLQSDQFTELTGLPDTLPARGFIWVGISRHALEVSNADLQAALQRWTGGQLVDLHVSDLLNVQLPSHFDYTSWYDVLVFRRLAAGAGSEPLFVDERHGALANARVHHRPAKPPPMTTKCGRDDSGSMAKP